MADSSKYAGFIDQATDRLEQIKQSLLKHEKNPNDREFLNDIYRAVHAIKNGALPAGLGRISELCFHLENLLQQIRQDRLAVNPEKIDILAAGRDRLSKLLHDLNTTDKERATVKDLLKRVQQEMAATSEVVQPATAPLPPVQPADPFSALEQLTPALEFPATDPVAEEAEDASSLLPDEIRKQEYDRELFQIFIEQMQENISLLRALINDYPAAPNQAKIITLCSELVGRLQTSANYMGYDRLADYYLQWVAELEMAGVELTMGTPTSLSFMEERLTMIAGLFPQVQDTPASAAAVRKAWGELSPPQSVASAIAQTSAKAGDGEPFSDFFGDMATTFDGSAEPVAALSGHEPPERKPHSEPPKTGAALSRKKRIQAAPVTLDPSFFDQERQSAAFDKELFQIFVDQLQENLSQLRTLVDRYSKEAHKSAIVDQCSALVGKLQASANYMGYDQLAEYYLQWIAELEMAGVDLSMGTAVPFAFMDEKIGKILEIFPEVKEVSAPVTIVPEPAAPPPPPKKPKENVPDESESFKELFIGMDDEEEDEEAFLDDSAPVAALTGYDEEERWQEPHMVLDADLPEVDNFFGDEHEAAPLLAPSLSVENPLTDEENAPEPEPVAALSSADEFIETRAVPRIKEAAVSEVDEFFSTFGVDLPDLTPTKAPAPQTPLDKTTPDAAYLFEDEEPAPSSEPEPVAALAGAELQFDVEESASAEENTLPEIENFFGEFIEGEEVSFDIGAEPIAALSGEEPAGAPAQEAPRKKPGEDIESLFLDDDEQLTAPTKPMIEDVEELFAAAEGGDDLDFDVEDEALAAFGDSPAADLLFEEMPSPLSRKKFTEPVDDLTALFNDIEEETVPEEASTPETESTPPERQELFRKLSDALKSMEEEVPTLEAAMDKSKARAAKAVSEPQTGQDVRETEEERKLFERLLGALEATAEDDDQAAAKPIDQVIEEILAAADIAPSEKTPPSEAQGQISAPDIRQSFGLDAGRLDSLLDQVGELVANRSALAHLYQEVGNLRHRLREASITDRTELSPLQDLLDRLQEATSSLRRVSGEIRDGILKVKMIPAGRLFELYHEVLADLAQKSKRRVELRIQGEDTEIDQFSVQDINDCLLHLITNGVEHGIESPAERRQLGKSDTGAITLRAAHEGNYVVIEVIDDGRGIDPKIIKATALARQMFSGDELYRMSDHDLTRLIMTPGFSTEPGAPPNARIPGLDRVKSIIDGLGGIIQCSTTVGQGTCIRLLVPLKLPTFRVLKVRAGGEVFALPLSGVEEILRASSELLIQGDGGEQISYRAENIPFHSLAGLAGVEGAREHGPRFPVVVINTDEGLIGLLVDELIGLEEIAVKPLAEHMRDHHEPAGAPIKGDGDFSFIADVSGLMKTATAAARN